MSYFSKSNAFLLFLILISHQNAKSEIFKIVDKTTGHVTLTNFGPGKVKPLEQSPPEIEKKAIQKSQHKAVDKNQFPFVSKEQQAEMDSDRLSILKDELRNEKDALEKARRLNSPNDVVNRHNANIDSLVREISLLKK
jgi:hypothetical protein